jgi:Phosphoadenosine phosphosulfate reductase family
MRKTTTETTRDQERIASDSRPSAGAVNVLSFGGGVQTVAMLRMVIAKEMPRPDVVVFADTGDEKVATYRVLDREQRQAERAGIAFVRVDNGVKLSDAMKRGDGVFSPAFTRSERGPGRMPFKSCTGRWKIEPIRRYLRSKGVERANVWLGMTTDEIHRVKPADVQWAANTHPFIERGVRRAECEGVLANLGLRPVKSACVHCPNRTRRGWETIRAVEADWTRAVAVDDAIRNAQPDCETFCHTDRAPLTEVVQEPPPTLFPLDETDMADECEGVCAA